MDSISNGIEWKKLAEPQADGYDSGVVLALVAENEFCPLPKELESLPFADAQIEVNQDPILNGFEGCRPASLDHPNIRKAEELLRMWPEGFGQCQKLLHSIGVSECDSLGTDQVVGSICGAGSFGFGSIAVTVNHHMGLAEGIIHEMAHHKLKALGVEFESAMRLVKNSQSDTYPSPIRYDCLRPMTAVLHAQYSYIHIIALDCEVAAKEREGDYRVEVILRNSVAVIVPKLEFGMATLRKHWVKDAEGEQFALGLFEWSERVLERSKALLSKYQIDVKPFDHPLS